MGNYLFYLISLSPTFFIIQGYKIYLPFKLFFKQGYDFV